MRVSVEGCLRTSLARHNTEAPRVHDGRSMRAERNRRAIAESFLD